jgi:hypothetical protein
MRTVLDILFGEASQTIYHDAAEGRPSSVTSVAVYPWDGSDDGTAESAITGSGSVETDPNTTIDAASGYGQTDARKLNVTATTGFAVDRTYLANTADGAKEWFDVAEIDSGNHVIARHPLHNAYASADTVQSTRITATIDSTWVADESNLIDSAGPNPMYRVRWEYVVGGVTYVADSYFNLVRYVGKHGVRPQDMDALHPQWLDSLPTDHRNNQGRTLIDDAYRAVKMDLHAVWTDDSMVANAEVVDELTRYKALELGALANAMRGNDSGRYEFAKSAYQSRLDSLVRITPKVPIRDTTGAAANVNPIGISRR